MKAREFINEKKVSEVAPFLAALGGALARGAASVGSNLAKGAAGKAVQGATQLGKQAATSAIGTIGSSGTTTAPTQQKPPTTTPPVGIPANTKIEQIPGSSPNNLKFKIGDAVFSLDPKDPKNAQALQQLGQATQPQK